MRSFYCQLDYSDVPYISPEGGKTGTLANNGCGNCSVSMIIENMLDRPFPPEECARLAKMCGAREGHGTDMFIFGPYVASAFGIRERSTRSVDEAYDFLCRHKGMVIANIRGNRPEDGYLGVFSDEGHYVVIAQAVQDRTFPWPRPVKVWDPMYRQGSGRYEVPGRFGKVIPEGTDCYSSMDVFIEDCKDRSFFLFGSDVTPLTVPVMALCAEGDCQRRLRQALEKEGAKVKVLTEAQLSALAENPEGFPDALVFSGKIDPGIIRKFHERQKPVLGVGEGICPVAEAFGAKVRNLRPGDGSSRTANSCFGTRFEAVTKTVCTGPEWAEADVVLSDSLRLAASCDTEKASRALALEACEWALTLGLSWHPEDLPDDPSSRKIFRALVTLARRRLPLQGQ